MDTSSLSEQERQSPDAVSKSELAMFPLDEPETEDICSPVLFELPAAIIRIGRSPDGTRRGARRAGSGFWY